ncbi:alpha/beta fold hydrolase [Nocardioides houyundeii]|uniref:alpha/beta fold hydrolase n=1 Tax=Nocardioides houyundeii TaxID=2045452 RepID=UPI000C79192B|nr:alpha/beta fold hydrolase [Nocardioides houyundeii]
MLRPLATALATAALMFAGLTAPTSASPHPGPAPKEERRPIVFVHGSSGSGSQFESQAQRYASNGYPVSWIEAHEYDSTFATNSLADVHAALDARIDALRERTGAEQVDVLAHSLGTYVLQRYLTSSPERAAEVAHYVNLDGAPADEPPGGVDTLAIWGENNAAGEITGARNVHLDDQGHTETVTSPESFTEAYTFFTDKAPRTTEVVRAHGRIDVSGRAVLFPSNVGVDGATLEVHRVNAHTGRRIGRRPVATYQLSGNGSFGPFKASPTASYEFALIWPGGPTHHFYRQPFRRSNSLVRLLASVPGTGLDAATEKSDAHVNLTVNRNKEWWGDQGEAGDTLSIGGQNVLTPAVAPRKRRIIGMFAFDAGSDKVSATDAVLPAFASLPFITGTDVYLPVSERGTVRLVAKARGERRPQVINVPALPSSGHRISVQFDDFVPRLR